MSLRDSCNDTAVRPDKNTLFIVMSLLYLRYPEIYFRYAWRESPCPNGIENCAIYSANSTTDTLALPAPPFITDNSAWNYVK